MKNIVVCIPNSLLAGGIVMYLERDPNFRVYRDDSAIRIEEFCVVARADVVVAEVRERSPHTIEEWNDRIKEIRKKLPDCKTVYVVDENSSPDLADRVALVRSEKLIDAFVYGTVSGEYLTAVVGSL